MEPRKTAKPVESRSEVQSSLPRQPERKRRFQIVKLEERIAPGGGHGNGHNTNNGHTCIGTCGAGPWPTPSRQQEGEKGDVVKQLDWTLPVHFAAPEKPHWPGIAPALGLRAGRWPLHFIADRFGIGVSTW